MFHLTITHQKPDGNLVSEASKEASTGGKIYPINVQLPFTVG
jgi:hypothetical protein